MMITDKTKEVYDFLNFVCNTDKFLSLKKGLKYLLMYREETCGFHDDKRIDAVIRLASIEDGKEKTFHLGTGIEVKTSYTDFNSGKGINFYSYPHTYLLVTKFDKYEKAIEQTKLAAPHVGILVYDNFNIEILKKAQFYNYYDRYLLSKINIISDEEYFEKNNYKMCSQKEKEKLKQEYFEIALEDCVSNYFEDVLSEVGKK